MDPIVGGVLAALNVLVLLGLLAVEAHLTASGEQKLAAGASGLSVLAAISLLLLATLLAGHLLRRLRRGPPAQPPAASPAIPAEANAAPPEAARVRTPEPGRRA